MRDFTLATYRLLLQHFLNAGYTIMPFGDYCEQHPQGRCLILRHDVDLRAVNSLRTAEIEHELGIRASYYFRVIPQSNQPDIIRRIAALGHEIGYHYEDMSIAHGDTTKALAHFAEQLAYFRTFYPVRTICMHGAPTSHYDGRDLWKQYDYHQYGIIGEPYFDMDFDHAFYLTDTGRCWDGFRVSVRDKVPQQDGWTKQGWTFHSSQDIMAALSQTDNTLWNEIPSTIMMTTHPQRWTDQLLPWLVESIVQRLKNMVKRILIYCH